MRKHTDPGVAPPAPGSVCPRPPPRSGEYHYSGADEDDIPTKPDGSRQPELLQLVRIVDSMPTVERRRFIALAESYRKCQLGRRVLLEEMARELAGIKE